MAIVINFAALSQLFLKLFCFLDQIYMLTKILAIFDVLTMKFYTNILSVSPLIGLINSPS